MRMAHVMAGATAGGAELFFERLTAALHANGDTVLPVIRRNPARAARLAAMAPVQLRFGGPLDLLTRPRLARTLRRFAPDLVMAWMSRAAAAAPRGDWLLTGRLGGYYDLRRFRHCDHLVVNTRGLLRWVGREGWPADRAHHLPNFAPDLAGAAPAALPVPAGAPVVLALGRLHVNKAFDVLLRALPHLPGVHAVIAGDGPERDNLAQLARAEGVAGRAHLVGWQADSASLLAAATVLACPSRQEPLGNVVLEAFSARVPVVAAAVDGPLELIREAQTGLLVPPEDPAALAEALGRALGNRAFAAGLASAARLEYETLHAEAPVLNRWHAVLTHLVETR